MNEAFSGRMQIWIERIKVKRLKHKTIKVVQHSMKITLKKVDKRIIEVKIRLKRRKTLDILRGYI